MKTLIVIREHDYEWLVDMFHGVHPLLIPICNKPFIEFLVDFSIISGSDAIRIVSDGLLGDVERYCENGGRWGVEISYGRMQPADSLDTVIEKNRRFCFDGRVMIVSGFLFIHYDKKSDYRTLFASLPSGEVHSCCGGTVRLTGSPSLQTNTSVTRAVVLTAIDSIGKYYDLSMEILKNELTNYVLPGYGSEADCFIGRNVIIPKSADIKKPVMIGNNVQIMSNTIIDANSVIGSNVIIDRNSLISESIVMDNTYVGEHLEIQHKIAAGNLLIDPESGTSLVMEDRHLLTSMEESRPAATLIRRMVHTIMATLLIILQLLPWLILRPILGIQGKWTRKKELYYTGRQEKTITLKVTTIGENGALAIVARALSLERFTLLFRVLGGDLALIGNQPIPIDASIRIIPSSKAGYRPAVFSYAEAEKWPEIGIDREIVEYYYTVHCNPLNDIAMIQKALFNRTHKIEPA